tara:strand:+ start:2014 stop:2298 length:285 start_codon:yes stop_codon:yes gene_type:complete
MIIDHRANLDTIWEVLQMAREDCISEDGGGSHDEQWQDVCLAMAQVSEELGIDEVAEEQAMMAAEEEADKGDYLYEQQRDRLMMEQWENEQANE